jgi:acyl transferase domain-containing protein
MKEPSSQSGNEIAVIGMAGRFPGAQNVAELWRNLIGGVESVTDFSDEQLRAAGVDSVLLDHPQLVRKGAILSGIDLFDASFFGLTPREAELTDPQHRLFLECAWETLEDAACDPETFPGLIGVFAGSGFSRYLLNNLATNPELLQLMGDLQIAIGNERDSLSSKVSYKLDLRGPSLAVQTFCSTSLVAVHIACQSLLNFECDVALAGGVAIDLPQEKGYFYTPGGVLSPDGRCRTFDAQAQGSIMGNGVASVALKRMDDAMTDGDCVRAVIKGSAINNDGARKVGYSAPGLDGQAAVIVEALGNAGVDPSTVTCIEAHGTATPLGDSVELAALMKAFKPARKKGFCALGSAKPNIGHLDRAAGVTGLIKAVLSLEARLLPPSLHFERSSPEIQLDDSPFYVNSRLAEWQSDDGPLRAGVSAFGIGGTNAHVILEEAPASPPSSPSRPWQLLVISAKTEGALAGATARLSDHLRRNLGLPLADVAHTLKIGRTAFNHRRILVAANTAGAADALARLDPRVVLTGCQERRNRPVLFLLPGVGDHYPDMGRGLYESEPLFRKTVDHCCEILRPELGLDLREVLYPARPASPGGNGPEPGIDLRRMLRRESKSADPAADRLDQTWLAQPAVFVVEHALARLWMAWGIAPQGMLGYSLGEYVAACLAGVFSLEDALRLVARRARLIQELPAGGMLGVSLSETALEPYITHEISLAAVNGPFFSVLAGPLGAIEDLERRLSGEQIAFRRLPATHAFHSSMLEPVAASLGRLVAQLRLQPPCLPYVSNVTGDWIRPEQATDPQYWIRHLCAPVRFGDGLRRLASEHPDRILLEVGPGQSLGSIARQQGETGGDPLMLPSLRALYERREDLPYLLLTLGKLWLAGARPDWKSFYRGEARRRLPLPTYAFERKRYWVEPGTAGPLTAPPAKGKKADLAEWFYLPAWKPSLLPVEEPSSEGDLGWIAFVDDGSLCRRVLERLRSGERVIAVRAGGSFERIAPDEYVIDPLEAGDYDRLLGALLASGGLPRKISHLWSAAPLSARDEERFDRAQASGFFSLLFLAQALGRRNVIDSLRLCVVSSGAVQVSGTEVLHPERGTLAGPCRVIPQELLNVTCRAIDVELPESGSWREERLAERLAIELSQERSDLTVAYRREERWVQALDPVRLEGAPGRKPRVREEGVYLITGGLGGVGLILAQHLARKFRAKLALIGRSGLPPRERWPALLASPPEGDPQARRIRKILDLEESGAEILVLAADVADEAQMRAAVAHVHERFGALHGVVHAAGIADERAFRTLEETSPAECAGQFRPKVAGVQVLERVLRDQEPDFVLLFSSLSAVLGGLGFAAYAAANAFMDLFAQRCERDSRVPWISVDWDSWPSHEEQYAVLGGTVAEFTMTREEGAEAFERVLSGAVGSRIVHSTGDLQARIDQWVKLEASRESVRRGSGRLDRRPELTTRYAPPASGVERVVAELWKSLLGIEPVGIHDNFFELGGHSLLATQLFSQIRKAFLVDLPLRAVFEAPTVSELASLIAESRPAGPRGTEAPPITPVDRNGEIPLSFSQQRHWFLHQLESDNRLFNEIGVLELRGDLDVSAFIQSVNDLAQRHEVLRTVFLATADGQPVQVIRDEGRIEIPLIDLGHLEENLAHAQLQQVLQTEVHHSFDLGQGPLVRCSLTRIGMRRHVAAVNMHHIITDGVSMAIFRRELAECYTARVQGRLPALEELPIQYADFACWQRRWLHGEMLENHLGYWRRQLAGAIPTIDLPTDRPRPRMPDFRGARQLVVIPERLTNLLSDLSQETGITVFTTLSASFLALLHSYSGQDDITLGAPVANRGRMEIADLFGCFINALPLRVDMSGDPRFRELLVRTKETILGALAHEELPFDKLVEELNPERSRSRWPLFQVVFNFQNEWLASPSLHGLEAELVHLESILPAKYDLTLYLREERGVLTGSLSYQTALFEPGTIEHMAGRFARMLEQVVANPDVRLSKLSLLSETEKRRGGMENDRDDPGNLLIRRRRAVEFSPRPSL